jgi:dolichol-phosphate mannosyltransferase
VGFSFTNGYTASMAPFAALYARIETFLGAKIFKIVRYLISGGTAAASNLLALFLLVHFGHIHYLQASVLAFAMSVAVSFTMQKFWTFRDTPLHDVHTQFARYLVVILVNLLLNTTLVYLLVEKAGMWYLIAQGIATIIVAVLGYFGYRHFVFRDRTPPPA